MVIAGGSLITTNCSLYVAGSISDPFNAVGLLIISNAVVQARDVTIASASPSSGTIELIGGKMTMSSSLNIGTGEEQARGSLLVANGALLVVTNGGMSTFEWGPASELGGIITVTNATMLARELVWWRSFHRVWHCNTAGIVDFGLRRGVLRWRQTRRHERLNAR